MHALYRHTHIKVGKAEFLGRALAKPHVYLAEEVRKHFFYGPFFLRVALVFDSFDIITHV